MVVAFGNVIVTGIPVGFELNVKVESFGGFGSVSEPVVEINGWSIHAHPLFLDQLDALIGEVAKARKKDAAGYRKKRSAKLLAAILKVAFEDIPADPARHFLVSDRTP